MESKKHSFGEQIIRQRQREIVEAESQKQSGNPISAERRYADFEKKMKAAIASTPTSNMNDSQALYARQKAAVMELLKDPNIDFYSIRDLYDVVGGVVETSASIGEDQLRVKLENDPEVRDLALQRIKDKEKTQVRTYIGALLEAGYLDLSELKKEVEEYGKHQLDTEVNGDALAALYFQEIIKTPEFFTKYLEAVLAKIPSVEMKTLIEKSIRSGDWRQTLHAWAEVPNSMEALSEDVKQALGFFIRQLVQKEAKGLLSEGQLMYWQVPMEKRQEFVGSMRELGQLIEQSLPEITKFLNRMSDEVGKEYGTQSDVEKLQFLTNVEKRRANRSERNRENLPDLSDEEREKYAKLIKALLQKRPWHKFQLPLFLRYRGEIPDLKTAKRVADAALEEIVATRMPQDIGYQERHDFLWEQMQQVSQLLYQFSGGDIGYVAVEDYLKDKWFRGDQETVKVAA